MNQAIGTQTQITVDGAGFILADTVDIDALRDEIQLAVETTGRFVDFQVTGNRDASILMTSRTHVSFLTEHVSVDLGHVITLRNDLRDWDLL